MWLRDALEDVGAFFRDEEQFTAAPDEQALPVIKRADGDRLVNLELLHQRPSRSRGAAHCATVQDLATLITRHDPAGVCLVYQQATSGAFCCIFNDDQPNVPGWRDWRVAYSPTSSESWKAWSAIDGKWMPQIEMAEFIQDRSADFAQPAGAVMLDLAQNFDVVRGGRFTSGVRLDSGMTRLTVENTAQSTTIDIPESVVLGMPVFRKSAAFQINARFRWRIQDNALRLGFKIIDREALIEAAVDELRDDLRRLLTQHTILQVDEPPHPVSALGAL